MAGLSTKDMLRPVNLFTALIFTFLLCGFALAETTLEVKISKDKVETGEVFTYTVKVKGNFISPKLTLPDFKNFIIISQNQGENYSLEGNTATVEYLLTYSLMAARPGVFTIKGVILKEKNKQTQTEPLSVEVIGKPLQDKRKVQPYLEQGTDI